MFVVGITNLAWIAAIVLVNPSPLDAVAPVTTAPAMP